jgi:hypothetical protein
MLPPATTGAAPPARSRPILPAGVKAPPFSTSRLGYIDAKAAGSWSAKDHAANADGIVAVEISAAAISVLSTVIIILRWFTRAENSRLAITAALSVAFPEWNFLNETDVGISAGDCVLPRITLTRRRNAQEIPALCDADSVFFVTIALAIVRGRRAPDT